MKMLQVIKSVFLIVLLGAVLTGCSATSNSMTEASSGFVLSEDMLENIDMSLDIRSLSNNTYEVDVDVVNYNSTSVGLVLVSDIQTNVLTHSGSVLLGLQDAGMTEGDSQEVYEIDANETYTLDTLTFSTSQRDLTVEVQVTYRLDNGVLTSKVKELEVSI